MSALVGFSHKGQERQEQDLGEEEPSAAACEKKFKKFVIGCHRAHTFTWLNLLLEPKRLLQRFGFVFLETGVYAHLRQPPRKKILKIFCHRCHGRAYS